MIKTLLALVMITFVSASAGYAEDPAPQSAPPDEQQELAPSEFVFPKVKPEFEVWGGYRYIHIDGDRKVEEFEYPHSSVTLGGEARVVSYPHRLHLDFDIRNEKDYYGDLTYAYKDLVLFRGINSTLWHNLENIRYFNIPSTANPTVTQGDKHKEYGIKVGLTNLQLRLKMPDFPAHLYGEANFVTKDGTFQQRFLGGAASVQAINKVTEKRELDTLTQVYTVGVNSHLGPVEIDYSHTEKRFDVDDDRKPIYNYVSGAGATLPPGRYEHNVLPELKSSTDTIRLHTNYTGSIVASGTLSWSDKENRNNSATADNFFGAGDVTLMPTDRLTFFLKYRHKESDHDSPDTANIRNLTTNVVYTSPVYEPVSSVTDIYSAAIRFRALPNLTMRGEFTYEAIRREYNEYWNEPESTDKATLLLSADWKIYKSLKLKLRYKHENINDPSHNTEPDELYEVHAALSWTPLPGLTTFLSYTNRHESRDSTHYLYALSGVEFEKDFDGREVNEDRFTGVVSYAALKNFNITGTYSYLRNRTKQDLAYNCNTATGICANAPSLLPRPGTPFPDSMVPFETVAHTYSVDMTYSPINELSLNGNFTYSMTKGIFDPGNVLGNQIIDDFSQHKTREMIYSASGEYRFKHGLSAGLQYRYTTFNDATGNVYNDTNDGRAHLVLLTLTKKW